MYTGRFLRQAVRISLSISVTALRGVSLACASYVCVGVQEMGIAPVRHRVVHPQAAFYGPQRYRSGDADDRKL